MVSVPCNSNGKDNEYEYNSLKICRYLKIVIKKKSEDSFIAERKFTSCYNNKNVYRLRIFIELHMKKTLKGK